MSSNRTPLFVVTLCFATMCGHGSQAVAQAWQVVRLGGDPALPFFNTRAVGIHQGVVVGYDFSGALRWDVPLQPGSTVQPTLIDPQAHYLGIGAGGIVGSQVGVNLVKAAYWPSGQPMVPLRPQPQSASSAYATSGDQQVGIVNEQGIQRAALWRGSASSYVDLHPANAEWSVANATDGQFQGGQISISVPGVGRAFRAALWSGMASNVMDITPSHAALGSVLAMVPGQQVGWTQARGGTARAAIWSGTAASHQDLHPFGTVGGSEIYGTCGVAQVGVAGVSGVASAGVWFGSAESYVPLHQFLPSQYLWSNAQAVEYRDGRYWVVGSARRASGEYDAVLWIGVPAPPSAALLFLTGVALLRHRRGDKGSSPHIAQN